MNALTRQVREQELLQLCHADPQHVLALYREAIGTWPGGGLPPHFSFVGLVRAIADYEERSDKLSDQME
jgi:hypothetical protein